MRTLSKKDYDPLLGAGKHRLSLGELEDLAVVPFSGSGTRGSLFDALKELLRRMKLFGVRCELWIDGSFLTKKVDPEDIDLTIVIAKPDFDLMPPAMKNQITLLCTKQHTLSPALDCYLTDSTDKSRLEYWDSMWGSGRNNEPKGYIVLGVPA